jgi:hypothetical protein
MRTADGALDLSARASDDIGLADGYFEIIVTAGEEETGGVQGRTTAIGRTAFGDVRTAGLSARLAWSALGLHPGDVVSIRAIARDGNTVSGPGVGTSETRTFRLATKEEFDSVNVAGAPTMIDSAYMTQRLIVIATRELLARPRPRDTIVKTSGHLAGRQETLRSRVDELLHGGEGGLGEAMSALERVLFDTAFASMSDAALSLEVAEPRAALPRELIALAALDSVRKLQHRLYLRGQPPNIVVNVARVRLSGTDKPDAGARRPAAPTDSVARALMAELARLDSIPRAEEADVLARMQVAAFGVSPPLAAALGDALTALGAHGDTRPALARARRLLAGPVQHDTALTTWTDP